MHIFLSPHFDDAVYSCGGSIHCLSRKGEAVEIYTLMSGIPQGPLPDTSIIRNVTKRWQAGDNPVPARREEDVAAARCIGASVRFTPLLDCIFRTVQDEALYPSQSSIFGEIHPKDPTLEELTLLEFDFSNASCIYAPLAAGHHVDHQLVRDWACILGLSYPHLRVFFYEDFPYTRDSKAVVRAAAELAVPLRPHPFYFEEADLVAKAKGAAAHRSQISSFWRAEEDILPDLQQAFRAEDAPGPYVERYHMLDVS